MLPDSVSFQNAYIKFDTYSYLFSGGFLNHLVHLVGHIDC